MKKITFFTLFVLSTLISSATAPYNFNYQAVVRDADGKLVANKSVSFQIKLRYFNWDGAVVYSETHEVMTNDYGLANLIIGKGTSGGGFDTINWSQEHYYLNVLVDIDGGTNYQDMGTTQLLSVPYANYAQNALKATSANSALQASHADNADHSKHADSTIFAGYSDYAQNANYAQNASDKIAFFAKNTASDAISSAGNQKVELDQEFFDYGNNFSNTTDRFTAPVTGIYNFSASAHYVGLSQIYLMIVVNGTSQYFLSYTDGSPSLCSGSVSLKLNASDYVELWINSSASSYNIGGSNLDTSNLTYLSGFLVFPE